MSHLGAVRGPVALERVLLKAVRVAGEDFDAAVSRRVRPHVPSTQRVVLSHSHALSTSIDINQYICQLSHSNS